MIVQMKKVFLMGAMEKREELLQKLQSLGVVHIQPVSTKKIRKSSSLEEKLANIKTAIEILGAHPKSESIEGQKAQLPLDTVVSECLRLRNEIKNLREALAEIQTQKTEVGKWGDFSLPCLLKLQSEGVVFRFWKCPEKNIPQFQADSIFPQSKEGNIVWLITMSYQDGQTVAPPEAQEVVLKKGTKELAQDIVQAEEQIVLNSKKMESLKQLLPDLQKYCREVEDEVTIEDARSGMLAHEELFGLAGWVPTNLVANLQKEMQDLPVGLEIQDAAPGDEPPTLIQNPRWIQSILDAVKIYATPGYNEWDPSPLVYIAFTVFFSMIVGDAGYGILLFILMQALHGKLKKSDVGSRVYRLMTGLAIGCIVFGALGGTWFAIDVQYLPEPLKYFYILKVDNPDSPDAQARYFNFMMWIAIYIGVIHLTAARIVQAARLSNSLRCIAELAWIVCLWSLALYVHQGFAWGLHGLTASLVLVFLFSGSGSIFQRFGEGLLGVIGFSQNFADVLSYLRLFALGLASAMMGSIFNTLAVQMRDAIPGWGYIFMILILVIGHTVNLLLSIMGGFIHGLRLNFLEFYRYCFEGTGYDYRPLAKLKN